MPRGIYLSEDLRKKIVEFHVEGKKQIEIANLLKIHKSIVSRTIKNFKERNSTSSLKKLGRPRKTTPQHDHRIKRIAQRDPHLSATAISNELGDVSLSRKTIQRRLKEFGIISRRTAKKPFISRKNRKARLDFAKKYLNWTVSDCKLVLFSDESKFNLFGSDGKRFVHRPAHERYNPKYTKSTVKHGGGSVMLWGCFSSFGTGPVFNITQNMDRFLYLDILKNTMLPYAEDNLPLRWVFQHDNDPKHKCKLVTEWLEKEKVKVLKWPSQSPDLNPIENLWEALKRKVSGHNVRNKGQFLEILKEAWESISPEIIETLIESMPRRLREVIKNKGYATHY